MIFFNKKKPKIIIKHGRLLEPFFQAYVRVNYPDYQFPSEEKIKEKVKIFQNAWNQVGDNLINQIYKITGLKFKREVIDCYIVSATDRCMSAPLIIKSRLKEEEFVDTMLHELLHIILVDNKIKRIKCLNESKITMDHLRVFAVLKYIYKDYMKDEDRLKRVIEKSQVGNNKDYARAWEIVDKIGYLNIIKGI